MAMFEGSKLVSEPSIDVGSANLLPEWPSRDSIYFLLWESVYREARRRVLGSTNLEPGPREQPQRLWG